MKSVLSYFSSYFYPGQSAPLGNHSAGRIANALYEVLSELGPVEYLDQADTTSGLRADLYIGHFYTFTRFCRNNTFDKTIAFYSVSDPIRRQNVLQDWAVEFGVPVAPWDAPPAGFDHEETMQQADLIFLVGNDYTRRTFPERWHRKIRLLNYSVDRRVFRPDNGRPRGPEMVYAASSCGLRKGFMDVLRVWAEVPAEVGTLHVVGNIEPPWDRLLREYNSGSIRFHGWIDSDTSRYRELLLRCRHAHLPTYEEGQMGTALEAIFSGCIPITTLASGLDERVLKHGIVIEPGKVDDQRGTVLEELFRSEASCAEARGAILSAAEAHHSWDEFRRRVLTGVEEVSGG